MMVVDSDVLIDALRGETSARERLDQELRTGALATTAITAFELRSGARSERARGQIETLLAPLTILPFDERAAEKAAEIRRGLEAGGTPIGMADYLIAGICLSRAASLLTRNRGHFTRIEGLRVEEPERS
ncbi:MAG: type II toxin-antitoxin system VapC family toxin [Longimicrobiales bacterium]|nr:type II toxin-antitoxin system VapC family toxin [Longimicrobiales bacterium]